MGRRKTKIKKDVIRFLGQIKELNIERVVIFGSRVRGDYLKHSDLDIIVVSEDFSAIPFIYRSNVIYKYYDAWKGEGYLEIICYTPEEFERKKTQIGMVKDAVEEGLVINAKEIKRRRLLART